MGMIAKALRGGGSFIVLRRWRIWDRVAPFDIQFGSLGWGVHGICGIIPLKIMLWDLL